MSFTRDLLYSRHGLSHKQIDDFLGNKPEEGYMSESLLQMKKVGVFIEITDLLKNAGISFVPFKGPLLSYGIYKDSTFRRYKDFDFLLDFSLIGKAISLLIDAGFRAGDYDWPSDVKIRQFKRTLRNQYQLFHPNKRVSIELHWCVFKYPSLKEEDIQKLVMKNISEVDFLDRSFTVLNKEMELLYLIIHGGFHNWRRLKWLTDIHQIIKMDVFDKSKFAQLVEEFRAQKIVSLCNGVLKHIYPGEATLPEFGKSSRFAIKLSLKKIDSISEREYESLWGLLQYSWFIFTIFPGMKYKIRVINTWILSARDAGSERLSFWTMIKSVFSPAGFLKKRYRVG